MEHGAQVHLLLTSPGHDRPALAPSPWRARVMTDRGPVDPPVAAQGLRPSPMSPRAERLLVAAVANDDLDALMHLARQSGPAQDAARVLAALRLPAVSVAEAVELLREALAGRQPTENKVLRRHWSDLRVTVALAPSVPALLPLDWTALVLLTAGLLAESGRTPEALAALDAAPPLPTTVLARTALLLFLGEHARVLDTTTTVANVDDVSALTLIARSVSARSIGDHATALDAVCAALADGSRDPAVLAAALEERAHLYGLTGDSGPARADLEALAAMAAGHTDVPIPHPISVHRLEKGGRTADDEEDAMERARTRMRRRISAIGEPGHFGGRHHSTYREEIASMFASGQLVAVEELLLGLLDAVEDEVDELGVALDPTFFLTLADLYEDLGRTEDLHALRERYRVAEERARAMAGEAHGHDVPDDGRTVGEGGQPGLDQVAPPSTPRRGMVTAGTVRSGLAAAAALPQTLTVGGPDAAADGGGAVATAERPTDGPTDGPSTDEVSAGPALDGRGDALRAGIGDHATQEPPEQPAPTSTANDPSDVAGEADRAGSGDTHAQDEDDPKGRRGELTPIERMVRGPRVRSL